MEFAAFFLGFLASGLHLLIVLTFEDLVASHVHPLVKADFLEHCKHERVERELPLSQLLYEDLLVTF